MSDSAAGFVFVISLMFGVAVGAGCSQMGMVPGFSWAAGIVAFVVMIVVMTLLAAPENPRK